MNIHITTSYENRRILVVDDNPSIHDDFRGILCSKPKNKAPAAAETELFSEPETREKQISFAITSAYQGREALDLVQQAVDKGDPFALAFVDIRMPPDWDGVETIEQIWKADPRVQVVICTSYCGHSWPQIIDRLGQTDRLLILKKPFDAVEALQMALTLTTKWNMARSAEGQQAALEATVEMKTRQLAKARNAAEAASRAKSRSLADISNGIAAPMTAIIQFTEDLLKRGDISKAPPTRVQAIQEILSSSQNLMALVSDIRDISSIDTGKMTLNHAEFDLREVVQRTLASHLKAARSKGIELTLRIEDSVPRDVVGDGERVGQILSNLVSNAVKFTHEGAVSVRVSLESEEDGTCIVRFEVTDTGIGIPMEHLDRLFIPFSQVDPESEPKSGAGLGLAISKSLAEMHGGNIGMSSAPGEGSTFWFTLALKRQCATLQKEG